MIKPKPVNRKLYIIIILLLSLTCTSHKHLKKAAIVDCDCEKIIEAYALIDYRYHRIDSVIGPKVIWYNNGFEENEEIDMLKKCTDLKIDYIKNKKGYYLVTTAHLQYTKGWIKKQCPTYLDRINLIQSKFEKGETDSIDYKVNEVIIEKGKND